MFYDIVLNIILILFPLTCYIIYLASMGENKEKIRNYYLDLALFSSLFLFVKYGTDINIYDIFILANIPLLISIMKDKKITTIILSGLIVLLSYSIFKFNIFYLISEYLIYYLLMVFLKKNKNMFNVIIIFTLLKIIFAYIYTDNLILLGSIIFMITSFIVLYLYDIGESMTNINLSIAKLKKEKLLSDSIFKITHEIKNPIAVCKGYLDMFDVDDKDKSERYVKILKDEIEHTLALLKDFLNFSKIEIINEELDIGMLLDDVYKDFKNYVEASGIDINYEEIDDDIYISGDYKRLKQVFINVIKNSMEAIKEKNITNGLITINSTIKDDFIDITVNDNGIGIDSQTLKMIYEPFYTTKQDGTGLGVCFSKEVIDGHSGSINYYTEYGKWTKVVISLPIKKSID